MTLEWWFSYVIAPVMVIIIVGFLGWLRSKFKSATAWLTKVYVTFCSMDTHMGKANAEMVRLNTNMETVFSRQDNQEQVLKVVVETQEKHGQEIAALKSAKK